MGNSASRCNTNRGKIPSSFSRESTTPSLQSSLSREEGEEGVLSEYTTSSASDHQSYSSDASEEGQEKKLDVEYVQRNALSRGGETNLSESFESDSSSILLNELSDNEDEEEDRGGKESTSGGSVEVNNVSFIAGEQAIGSYYSMAMSHGEVSLPKNGFVSRLVQFLRCTSSHNEESSKRKSSLENVFSDELIEAFSSEIAARDGQPFETESVATEPPTEGVHRMIIEKDWDGIKAFLVDERLSLHGWNKKGQSKQEIAFNASMGPINHESRSPLAAACTIVGGPPLEILYLLLATYPRSVGFPDCNGDIPLHHWIRNTRNPMVQQSQIDEDQLIDEIATLKLFYTLLPRTFSTANYDGDLPLHIAIQNGMTELRLVREIHECYPHAIKTMNKNGCFPAHFIGHSNISSETVEFFIETYQEAFITKNKDGLTAVFMMVAQKLPSSILYQLFLQFPFAADLRDGSDQTLLEKAWGVLMEEFNKHISKKRGILPVDITQGSIKSAWENVELIINALYHAYSDTHLGPKGSWKTLHAAASVHCPFDVLKFAIACYPHQVSEKNDVGSLPLHSHLCCPPYLDPAQCETITNLLLALQPTASSTYDGDHRLPLALALNYGKLWDSGVSKLIELFPGALRSKDTKTSMFPFMMAAATFDHDFRVLPSDRDIMRLNTIYELLTRAPDLIEKLVPNDEKDGKEKLRELTYNYWEKNRELNRRLNDNMETLSLMAVNQADLERDYMGETTNLHDEIHDLRNQLKTLQNAHKRSIQVLLQERTGLQEQVFEQKLLLERERMSIEIPMKIKKKKNRKYSFKRASKRVQ